MRLDCKKIKIRPPLLYFWVSLLPGTRPTLSQFLVFLIVSPGESCESSATAALRRERSPSAQQESPSED